jgi:hypothetical protein
LGKDFTIDQQTLTDFLPGNSALLSVMSDPSAVLFFRAFKPGIAGAKNFPLDSRAEW